jgi:Kip1 ubiquitination-promoting complex protein 2
MFGFISKLFLVVEMLTEIFLAVKRLLVPQKTLTRGSAKIINVRVITTHCGVLQFAVRHDEIVISLKKNILDAIGESDEDILMQMKLIRSKTGKVLGDFEYLDVLQVKSNEEFVLSYHRSEHVDNEDDLFAPGPCHDEIYAKTSHLIATIVEPAANFDYLLRLDDLKKLFVTLAQECAHVIAMHPHSMKLIMFYRQKMFNYIKTHEDVFKVMCQLGFSPEKVTTALLLNANNYKMTLDWLIDNVKYREVAATRSSKSPRTSSISSNRRNSILSSKFDPASATITERVDGLLEIVRFYAEKDEPVSLDYLSEMIYMGYEVDAAREALRLTKNNIGASCAHIAGEQSPSIMEFRRGISHSSQIYKDLLESADVQEVLSLPESFVSFITFIDKRAFLEAPNSNFYDLMEHIVDSYHEQKHSLAVNQFNNSLIPISALSAPT